jgi:hypothetical protein
MQKNGAVISGRYIVAKRLDGRCFVGMVESVKALAKGTLVTIRQIDDTFKNFYLENLVEWDTVIPQ